MRYYVAAMRGVATSGVRGQGPRPLRTGRALAAAGALAALALVGPAPAATPPPLPAPVQQAFLEHKRVVLALEAALRTTPDTALTGLPGFAVLLLACDGAGCVGAHQLRVEGAETGTDLDGQLPAVFSAGGWLPLAVAHVPGDRVRVAWRLGDKVRGAEVPLPPPGQVTVVESRGDGLAVRGPAAPGPEAAWRVALAERARGDRLAAVAVLAAERRLNTGLSAEQSLLLADLYADAGLLQEAEQGYAALATDPHPATRLRAQAGLARIDLERGRPRAVVERLTPVTPPPNDPLAGTVTDLLIRAHLALDEGRAATRLLPATGNDPYLAVNRAMAFIGVGDTFSALEQFKAAARSANRSVPDEAYLRERVLLAMGLLYGEQGRLDEALGAFSDMSPQGPLADRMRFGRGLAFVQHGDRVKAVAEFQGLERDFPDSPYALEGLLQMAEAYRALNAPRRAVAEYRKALERFQARARAADYLIADADRLPFDQGLTGLIFSGAWHPPAAPEEGDRYRGLEILFHTPGFAALFDEYRQVVLTMDRLEAINRRLAGGGQAEAAGRVRDAIDRLGVFRSLFEAAARRAVLQILKEERERLEDLSLTASLGITQSILFDRLGSEGEDLYFKGTP